MSADKANPVLARRRELYYAGLSDSEIARQTGAKRNTVTVWRRNNGLPPNVLALQLDAAGNARRMVLYQLGWGDRHIAREERVGHSSVREWRLRHKLRPNFRHGINECRNKRPDLSTVLTRIKRAIGRALPRDIADDAVMDMVRDVLDGTIPLTEIEVSARRYGNRVLDKFASRYGPRSLDEELGDSEGFRMIDMIADERSSSWLEEMGATVW